MEFMVYAEKFVTGLLFSCIIGSLKLAGSQSVEGAFEAF